ncbi:hypothetical protein MELA_01449 [Candidatus Methylomirabilis lanthanidiphila]|uniref:Rhamnogalacturonan lyase domain-containing protein n=1 Tax=Candidatus Methylomirabilis lanthanidiphila TaxID=2211376 RepID=A0A564ZIR6_9BACT|nr:carboxypeptidase regulatory-like domain-containing protein [Candidatus Methylomirabilis lanthanidiphila]VUZ85073.1 hypothetical protein MELA_01449 [Candidatus Methylomirabilis lanthanidiphila]
MTLSRTFVSSVALAVTLITLALTPAAHSYQEVAVTDGGTITGTVIFQGSPPPMKLIIPTKDQEVCGGIREEPHIVLSEDQGVRHAVVFLKDVQSGKAWGQPAKMPDLTNLKCDFVPHVQVVPVGSDLEIISVDAVLHATHGFLGKRTVFSVTLPNKGDRVTRPLKKTGMVRVECDAHGWMLGWIYVADNPYAAVTAQDGTFTITDVPPGAYTLVVWQEYLGLTETPVTVKAKDAVSVKIELNK